MKMLINGEFVENGNQLEVEDPATNEIIGIVPDAGIADVEKAVLSARDSHGVWESISVGKRKRILAAIADRIDAHTDQLAEIIVREVGKPLSEAKGEVSSASRVFRTFSTFNFDDTLIANDKNSMIYATHHPLGVTALILPWNYPFLVLSWKLAPALLAGNSIIVKPSPFTPMNALTLGEITQSILPAGVLNILSGGDEAGRDLVNHELVNKISFTGNVETGKTILKNSADTLKRVSLELGGNDPGILLKDFDMGALNSVFWSAFRNAGQVCIAIKRLYVHESIFSDVAEKLAVIASKVTLGHGLEANTKMGPINNLEQLRIVRDLVDDAKENNATILAGGVEPDGPGYFYRPTIITDVDDDSRIVREEQFGPVLPILPFSDEDEVIDRVNSLKFGLGASIWTRDLRKGMELAPQIQAGTTWVNTHMIVDPMAPFGGFKESGIGRELGRWGVEEFVNTQTVCIKK